ncbi:MAG: radical SAM protein, partial [Methylovirgula sp.]
PRSLTPEHVLALADMGVTRASLGVQDFEEQVQQTIRRLQSFEQTARVADQLRQANIGGINLDLMYGLPHQTMATMTKSTEQALTLAPDDYGTASQAAPPISRADFHAYADWFRRVSGRKDDDFPDISRRRSASISGRHPRQRDRQGHFALARQTHRRHGAGRQAR